LAGRGNKGVKKRALKQDVKLIPKIILCNTLNW
jgi:hypothetical protein